MIRNVAFWSIVLACCAAFDMYDENREPFGIDQNGDVLYNEENYDYQDIGPYAPEFRADPAHSLMLYQLFNSLQNGDDDRLHMRYRPKFNMVENPLGNYGHIPYSELMDPKGAVAKRTSIAPGGPVNINEHQVKPMNQPTKVTGKNVRKGRQRSTLGVLSQGVLFPPSKVKYIKFLNVCEKR